MGTCSNSGAFDAFRKAEEYRKWLTDKPKKMVKVCGTCSLVKVYEDGHLVIPLTKRYPDVCMDCSNEEFLELVKDIH